MQSEERSEEWVVDQYNRNRPIKDHIVASEDMTIQLDNNASGEDFVLTGATAWITIDGYSLHINNFDNRVSVHLYRLNHEAEDELEGFDYFKK